MREELSEGSIESKTQQVKVPEMVETVPAVAECVPSAVRKDPDCLRVSFADHPELLEKLRGIAIDEFRSPEQQILYLVNREIAHMGMSSL